MSEWTQVAVHDNTNSNSAGQSDTFLLVANPSFKVPEGLIAYSDFVSLAEEHDLLQAIDESDYSWEGFDQRRKVQRFSFNDKTSKEAAEPFCKLRDKIKNITGWKATHIAIEEYAVDKVAFSGDFASNQTVTTFESPAICSTQESSKCFIAQIPLKKAALQHLNKPKQRKVECWNLESANHCSDIYMARGSLFVKSTDCLWNWRSRVAASRETDDCVTLLKFYSLSKEALFQSKSAEDSSMDSFGYVPSSDDPAPSSGECMPPLEELLTIIVTTSPIKSNPSTEVLEKAMQTFVLGGTDFAYKCRKVIVCDGIRKREDEGVTKRHSNVKQALRNGIVSSDQAENYAVFKERLRQLCQSAPADSPFHNAQVEELSERQGYGFALRHALRTCISTPFVCVIQHDRTFMRPTPIRETVEAMWRNHFIKYVGMSMRSNLFYRDLFLAKYGRIYHDEFKRLIVRVPELLVKKERYGPNSESTNAMAFSSEILRENIMTLATNYHSSAHATIEQEWCRQNPPEEGMHQMSLTPTLFWYDNVHICDTKHYRDFVFKPSYKMVAKGGFVEDKLSPVLRRTIERLGLKEGHSRFGCYILDDHSGMFFTGHLDGGSYITDEEKKAIQEKL